LKLSRWKRPCGSYVKVGWKNDKTIIRLPRYVYDGRGSYILRIEKVNCLTTYGSTAQIFCDAASINYGRNQMAQHSFQFAAPDTEAPIILSFEKGDLEDIDVGFLPGDFTSYGPSRQGPRTSSNNSPVSVEEIIRDSIKDMLI
jgi:hypothetical protein